MFGFKKKISKDEKENLNKGLEKTKTSFLGKLSRAVAGKSKVDDDLLDNLEEVLASSDVGVDMTIKIIKKIEERVAKDKYLGVSELNTMLKEEIVSLLPNDDRDNEKESIKSKPQVIMVVGVNGAGKTTTIGKLASQFTKQGKKVVLGAADTFRAAAIDQLQVWADRNNCTMVRQEMGSDPASVAYDTIKSAMIQQADIVIIDTAGRLHNKVNLMNELSKIKRVMQKINPEFPQEVLLVLDGTTGQNAIEQAKHFTKATEVSSIAITKLDGTSKGGVVLGVSDRFQIPVKYIGVGEGIHDLQVFDKYEFVDSLFN